MPKREYHRGSVAERYWARVILGKSEDDCWGWRGGTTEKGYGLISQIGKGPDRVHRVSWRIHFGEIPEGLCVLHHCDNPPCSNPRHLFLGTKTENNADMRAKGRNDDETFITKGENHPRAKLTQAEVDLIRLLRTKGKTQEYLAKQFDVSRWAIRAILSHRNWR